MGQKLMPESDPNKHERCSSQQHGRAAAVGSDAYPDEIQSGQEQRLTPG